MGRGKTGLEEVGLGVKVGEIWAYGCKGLGLSRLHVSGLTDF